MSRHPAMVFAAGRGTRMRHLTADRPKPLIRLGGRTLLDRALDMLVDAGVARVVVNTHYLGAQIADALAAEARLAVALSPEAPAALETGGGLARALPLLGAAPVWTVNPDTAFRGPNPLTTLGEAPPPPGGARLLLVPRDRAHGHPGAGDFFMDAAGRLARRGAAPTAPYVYAGVQLIDPAPVAAVPGPVFSLNPVWDAMIAEGRLTGVAYPGDWCDVGQPESLPLAEALLADG